MSLGISRGLCVSLSVSGGFVCHSVRVTTLIIAAASGFPQLLELTGQVMQPPLRSSHPSDDGDLTKPSDDSDLTKRSQMISH